MRALESAIAGGAFPALEKIEVRHPAKGNNPAGKKSQQAVENALKKRKEASGVGASSQLSSQESSDDSNSSFA